MSADPPDEDGPAISYRALLEDSSVLAVFLIGFAVAFAVNAVPVAIPDMAVDLGLSDTEVGLVMTAFYLPMVVLIPVTSVLADFYGRKRIALPSMVLLGIAGPATLLVTSYPTLLALRALQGIAASATLPLTAAMIGDLYRGAEGTAAQGLRTSASSFGATLGPVIAGFLAVLGWQYPFALFGFAIPAALLADRYYEDPNRSSAGPAAIDEVRETLATYARQFVDRTSNRDFVVLTAGGFTLFSLKQAIKTFGPLFIVRELGEPVQVVGLVLGLYSVGRMVVSPMAGAVVARVGRKPTLVAAVGFLVVGMAAFPASPNVAWLAVAVLLFAAGDGLLNPTLSDTVASLAGYQLRGGLLSGLQSLKNVGNTIAPAAFGLILAGSGFDGLYLVAAGVAGMYGLAIMVFLGPDPGGIPE